jgi:hypothetical protein
MSQVNTLIVMMRKGWVSTDDAFRAGITSFHRRLADFRMRRSWRIENGTLYPEEFYTISGKDYILKDRERQIFTRWGKAKIKEYRLQAVK